MFIYNNSFGPDNPTTNLIAANNDGPGGIGTSEFQAQLVTNTNYFLVTIGYQPDDFGIFHNQITGSGSTLCDPAIIMSCDLSAATENFIFWNSVWYRPLVSNGACCSTLEPLSYHIYGPFTVNSNQLYQILSIQNGWDGVIFLYEAAFDPATPAINLYENNDDGSEGVGTSEMVVELDVSTEYFLVTTGYEKQHFGSFVNSIQGSGTITCTSLN
nr:hypothetical protein [Flavobacteriales bacterium]